MKRLWIVPVLVLFLACVLPVSAEGEGMKVNFTYSGARTYAESAYPFEGKTEAVLTAWKGERLFLKVAVEADSDQAVQISGEPLKSAEGTDEIPVSIGRLEGVTASLGLGENNGLPHETVYDRILSGVQEAELHAGTPSYFWITINTGNAPAGKYEGLISVHAGIDYDLSITVIVTPYSLAEAGMAFDLWQYPYSSLFRYDLIDDSEPFGAAHLAALKQETALYARTGGNRITCTISDEPWAHQTNYDSPSLVKWNRDGSGNLWFDFTAFDAWVELCDSLGINGPIECFSILPYDNALIIYDDMDVPGRVSYAPGTYEWNNAWQSFLFAFTDHMEEKGWLERACLFVDERGISEIGFVKDLLSQVPGAEAIRLGAAINAIPNNIEYYDIFDTISISIGSLPKEEGDLDVFLDHRRELGKETTLYNCSTTFPSAFALSDPAESVWTMLYAASRGFDGFLRWAYNAWPNGLNETADNPHFESGDTFLIYPDERKSEAMKPSWSVRLCMMEQGRNDFIKYQALRKRLSPETAAILETGFERLPRFYGRDNGYGMLTHRSEEERIQMMNEVIRLEALIEKAAAEAAAEQTGISFFQQKEAMGELS